MLTAAAAWPCTRSRHFVRVHELVFATNSRTSTHCTHMSFSLGTRSRTSPEPNSNRVSCQRCRAHTQVQQLSAMRGPGRRASSVSASVRSAWAPGWVQQQIERTVAAAWQSMCVGACRYTYAYSCKLTSEACVNVLCQLRHRCSTHAHIWEHMWRVC